MITADQVTPLKELVEPAQTLLVVLGPQSTSDQIAAATALGLSLQAAGKQVSIVAPDQIEPNESINGISDIQTKLGNKDLAISFLYSPETVDKVSYHIDEASQRFNLVIKPQRGKPPLDPQTVEFNLTGAEADLIFLVGVHSLESLEQLYFGFEQLYQNTYTIVFHSFEPTIGTVRLSTGDMSCMSEGVAGFLQLAELPIPGDAATNLLSAIEEATDGFRSLTTTADTFEKVAWLLRNGARRIKKSTPQVDHAVMLTSVTPPAQSKSSKKNGLSPVSKKKMGSLNHQPTEFSVGARG